MKKQLSLLNGALVGAGLMYLMDPERGKRRRSLVRDRVVHLMNVAGKTLGSASEDLSNRARGRVARTKSRLRQKPVSDDVLVARVRARMGRIVSHPRIIDVEAHEGHVTLAGSILAEELADLLECVRAIPGVASVDNRLTAHSEAGDIPSLQGGRPRPDLGKSAASPTWAPAARAAAYATGGALALYVANRERHRHAVEPSQIH